MRLRSFAGTVGLPVLLLVFLLALAACAPIPSLPAPTAVAPTAAPATFSPTPPVTSPLTPTVDIPTVAVTVPVTTTIPAVTAKPITPTVPAPMTPTPTIEVTSPTTETVTAPAWPSAIYRDEVGGWEIDYPETWSLIDVEPQVKEESLGYSVTLTSWQPQEPGTQGIPEGGSKVDIGVTKGGAETVDAAIEARRAEILGGDAGSQIVFEEPWDLASGLSGVHWTIQPSNGEAVYEFVTAVRGNRLMVSGYGDKALFEQVVATLRPLGAAKASEVLVPMVGAGGANEAAAAAAPQAAPVTATVYTVRAGDTLAKIAARFGVSVSAILAANPQITNPDRIYIGQRITIPGPGGNPPPTPPAGTTRVNIYMIGEGGGNVGCGDQVVAVRRDVPRTNAPLTAALNLLLSQKSEYYRESGLRNALWQSNLRIASITRSGSAWTINLTGSLRLGGVCDNPRVQAQLEQTALQFSTVRSVRYFVNGTPLERLLSGR